MFTINELIDKRATAWEAAKGFLDSHGDTLNAEDTATYDRMVKEVEDLGKQIDRLNKQAEIDNLLAQPVSTPIVNKPAQTEDEATGRASKAYNKAFWNNFRAKYPTREIVDALQVGTDSEGGYLVPDEFERTLVQALEEENVMRKIGHVIRTNSGDHKIPVVASHGTAAWTDEEAAYNEDDDAFTQISLGAYKLTTLMKVSEELLHDAAFNLEAYIAKEFGRRIGAAEETAFLTGNGTGKPTGVVGTATTGVTTAAATTIKADDLIDLVYALKAPYRRKAVWLLNDSTVATIRKMKDGEGRYLWQPAVTAGQPDMLFGRPVYTSAAMPEIEASATPVLFGDFDYFWIADRTTRAFKRLNELYAANGQVGFLANERVDGKLILAEAVQGLKMHA